MYSDRIDLNVGLLQAPQPVVAQLRLLPAVLIKGADYKRDEVVGGDFVEAAGGTVVLVDLVPGHSTTGMVRRSAESAS